MVETRTLNNLPGSSYSLKKSDWLKTTSPLNAEILLVDNVEILLVESAMSNNTEWTKLGPKITFLRQITAGRNLIGLDKRTYKQTLTIFNEPITLSFRKGKKKICCFLSY